MTKGSAERGSSRERPVRFWTRLRGASPSWGMVLRAAMLAGLFLVVEVTGLRPYTGVLSGTGSSSLFARVCGCAYIVLYLCFILLVPVFLISAAILRGFEWRASKRRVEGDGGAGAVCPGDDHRAL